MEQHLIEISNLVARWIHLIAGILWVGNSMLFNWLDRNLRADAAGASGKFGETWLLHSGGFYRVEKFRADAGLPPVLHWFKWQAYTTWITGFCLLLLVYHLGGAAHLRHESHRALSAEAVRWIGLGLIPAGWLVYDVFWRLMGARAPRFAAAASLAALAGLVHGLCLIFEGRAASMHVGALLGSLMAGNVFFHIIPSQKQMVRAVAAGGTQDLALSDRAKARSIHNNYLTFPVLYTMIGGHFAVIYGHPQHPNLLLLLFAMGALARHVLNLRFTFPRWRLALAATLLSFGGALLALLRTGATAAAVPVPADGQEPVRFAQVQAIVQARCVACHSRHPTQPALAAATGGVLYDSPEEIRVRAERIKLRVFTTRTMPLANLTGMTEAERETLARWVDQGAPIP